ncbi:copper chaperone PCu(A)C [Phenylobacterium sp.]|uniref:copper chaperone PCu(A)C n=1 Tax=Phenylobacterium sp. TaxID=1871053 RepID=UPI00289A3B75|nr:copper chaperone PCu(A)C [Phenylobacterium sp.]
MRHLPIIAAACALALAGAAHAAVYRLGTLEVVDPWSRPAAANGNGGGFMTITNRGAAADTLVAVETAAARRTEVHRSSTAGGVMKMERQDAGVTIPAGKSLAFAPGGYHVMFLGLTQPTRLGDRLPATLVFKSGAKLKVEFQVAAAAPGAAPAKAPAADAHQHH